MSRQILYPAIMPYQSRWLPVDDLHTLYIEESGHAAGLPVVFLHGGPGAGSGACDRRFFDPARYHIILFDQRGSGRSTPYASLKRNTTIALIGDIERIRTALNLERWLVFGGSWGATLALAYAEAHPERVLGLVLRGIFLGRSEDIEWFYQRGANRIFPDYWQDFLAPIPAAEHGDLLAAYHRRLTGSNDIARLQAARAWSQWEGRLATLLPNPAVEAHFTAPHLALPLARIESHFFVHHAFLKPNQLLREANRLADIPGVIVQGRYDMTCPVNQAYALQNAWPRARLKIIPDAGHSAIEPGITSALVQATDEMACCLMSA